MRRSRVGRAGHLPRSSCGQDEAAYMRRLCGEGSRSYLGRSRLVPERATVMKPEREVSRGRISARQAAEARSLREGPNEKESWSPCRRQRHCVRCPRKRSGRRTHAVKPRVRPPATKPMARDMTRTTQAPHAAAFLHAAGASDLNFSNRPVRDPHAGWCGRGPVRWDRPLSR